jgi:hypothetical protein
MDILIKSFNRPYYLDRCLFSIDKHVKRGIGKIVILDDGTPQVYLDRILLKYPKVIIQKSDLYDFKQEFTLNGLRPNNYIIPIDLWVKAAGEASENFILIEDDIWFVEDIDLDSIDTEIIQNSIVLAKLHWIGNPIINQSKETVFKRNFVLLKPKLFTINPLLYYIIFYKFDRFKIRKTLRFLKINTDERQLAYRTIYAVAGMIFNKHYFVKLWENHRNTVDEGLQIYNAIKIYNKQRDKNKFAHYKEEILKTGFMSSATNQNKERYDGNVDMFVFNKIMNEAWLNNQFEVINSLPKDIDMEEIISILDNNAKQKILSKDWLVWVESFKQQYRKIGCKID